MKKYIKPSLEYFDLSLAGNIMLEGSGGGLDNNPGTDDVNTGQGLAPKRRVF